MPDATTLNDLLHLSQELGLEPRKLAILGEGNTSARLSSDTFLVKASGSSLSTLKPGDVVECRFDAEVDAALLASRVDEAAKKPSVEAIFHAYFLSLANVNFVGHTHPIPVNQILCSPRARDFATKRTFPDEIVCCGPEAALVPYVDPGLELAKAIRGATAEFIARHGKPPRVILLENHGLIAPAEKPGGVLAATLMAAKAAEIFTGAAALGGPVFLTESDVRRIEGRQDEHYRRKALNI
jgi:rhamnose utilization protein RhaD (predicted bifunctional aldolase and dehydrogenase)